MLTSLCSNYLAGAEQDKMSTPGALGFSTAQKKQWSSVLAELAHTSIVP